MIKVIQFFCFAMLISCSEANTVNSNNGNDATPDGKIKMTETETKKWRQVTVKFMSFEGGFYGLVDEKGQKLLPMNLAKTYKVDGTVLKVKGNMIKDMMTTTQWGTPYEVTDIELIRMGKKDVGEAF